MNAPAQQGRLDAKVVLVTGSGSGIGRAVAHRCASDGAKVVVCDLDAAGVSSVVDEIRAYGEAVGVRADVRDDDDLDDLFATALSSFGRIDTVVANAGVGLPPTPFVDLTNEQWDRVIITNLTGVFKTLQRAARHLITQGEGGVLIATGSSTAIRPGSERAAYVAAKGAIHALVRTLAVELAPHKIRVNCLVPGLSDTPATRESAGYIERGLAEVPLGETVDADELGALASFMASEDARHMTGSVVVLDAGRTCA